MMNASDSARPRTPGIVYGTLSMAMLLLVSAIALTARQPPPPSVAEFAPKAVEQIKDAPSEQSSDFGSGEGGGAGGLGAAGGPGSTTTTTTVATTIPGAPPPKQVIDVARVRRCIGNPPRQIEDPQSPPCVNYFEGDNGGATSQGVTANEIAIAVPDWGDGLHPPLERFFNSRFELYGRKIKLINTRNDFAGGSPEQQIAAAVKADDERQVFASLSASFGGGFFYHQELARRRVVSAVDRPLFTETDMQRSAPYLYQYPMANDRYLQSYGSFLCSRFVGRPARFADDPVIGGTTRKIAVLSSVQQGDTPFDLGPFERELAKCGGTAAVKGRVEGGGDAGATQAQTQDFVLRAKQANATTFICFCNGVETGTAMRIATGNGYFPEWGVGTYEYQDDNFRLRSFMPAEQLENTFGLTVQPRQILPSSSPVEAAGKESDPGSSVVGNSIGGGIGNIEYRILLLIASGIQMAGARLTPQSFEKGLQTAVFPNPDSPITPGKVGFAGSHAMTVDAAEFFWSTTARSPYPEDDAGSICYVDRGARRRAGAYPAGDAPFFTSPCDSGA